MEIRTGKDILDNIRMLAASYTPEWQFDEQDPDIGSVLALLFADQMQENIRRYNLTLERDYVELMNLFGISPRPASPARSIVRMDMAQNTVSGRMLPGGTKLLAEGEGERPLIFETSHCIYVTQARLKCMFMASGVTGKIIPLKGKFQAVEYIDEDRGGSVQPVEDKAFTLFDFDGEGYGRTGLVMYHSHIFDGTDSDIRMEIAGAKGLAEEILGGKYRLSYYGRDGFCRITDLRIGEEGCLVFRKDAPCRKVKYEDGTYSALLLEPAGESSENIMASDIRFGAAESRWRRSMC